MRETVLTRVPFVVLLVACGSSDPSGLYADPDGGTPGAYKSATGGGGISAGGAGGSLGGSGGASGGSTATGGSGGEGNAGNSGGSEAGGGAPGEPSGGAGPGKCKSDKQCSPLICLKQLGVCGVPSVPGTPCERDLECASDECEDGYCE